ncbi:uncharacterized protein N0V89_011590 [Didymosphaeria variabile]|uniref:Uncharacterized protein n=1 Tax=Didymosphaeria variabile TaxID=1932322 RepID=A0A9W8XAH1_9PLEO|nr:uncharacterized protein N0V89_011590 [Didymosphaeria variabile]KAJ4345459.1 hypothetical protein N0V89_011590 [Didymosphaeria variabile]
MPTSPIPQTKAFVGLSLLDGGSFIASTNLLHADASNAKFRMYNWAFCISHGDERIVWDLGLDERAAPGFFLAATAATRGAHSVTGPHDHIPDKNRAILDGTHEIAQFCMPHREGKMSLHADLETAKNTIAKIRVLEKEHSFHVALAHDAEWLKEGSDQVLMSLLDAHMLLAAKERIPKEEVA